MFNCNVKKIISAILLTALILSSLSMIVLPKVTAQDNQATVLSYSWYSAAANSTAAANPGDLIVVGEIQNIGTSTIEYLGVMGSVFDTNNSELAETTTPVLGYYLLPGQKAPFYMEFTPDTSLSQDPNDQDWIPYIGNVSITPIAVTDYNQTAYSGLTIPANSVSASDSSGTYTVTGTLTNSGDQGVSEPTVVATFYNASGTVIGIDYTSLADTLAAHASASFTVTPIDDTTQMDAAITNYTLLAQYALNAGTTTPTPTSISQTPTPTPSNSNGATPTPTNSSPSTQNKISSKTLLEIVGTIAVVVVLGLLVSVFMVRRRGKTEQFESPPPPPENDLPPPPPPT